MDRRDFLKAFSAALASGGVMPAVARTERPSWPPPVDDPEDPLTDGEPVLLAPDATSMGVVWAVGTWATGGVEISESPDMADARLFPCHAYQGRVTVDDRVLSVRLENLKPGTRYYYRTFTVRCAFDPRSYNLSKIAEAEGTVHSFVTYGAEKASGRFTVMNDTHENKDALPRLFAAVEKFDPEVTLWNGDAINGPEWRECAVKAILNPPYLKADYASDRPLEFVMGNHERFGSWAASHLDEILPRRTGAFEWNHAFRQGDIAFICLDSGGDKPDDDPEKNGYGPLRDYTAYLTAQEKWLEDQFRRPEIASAPFVIAVCHIPIDRNHVRTKWGEILSRHGAQLVISGHTHKWAYTPKDGSRSWDELVGGGPRPGKAGSRGNPTLVRGEIADGRLAVTVEDVCNGVELKRLGYAPRTAAQRGGERDALKVLMIGNSFSISNFRQMPAVATSMGKRLTLASMYIGGCSLERHWKNACAPETKPYQVDISDGRHLKSNIPEMLKLEKWDVVTLQQASHDSWRPETYEPFGTNLIGMIRKLCPGAEIVLQETWSYTPED